MARKRTCNRVGCYGIVNDDVCPACGRQYGKWDRPGRASRIDRGYDQGWIKLRKWLIDQRRFEAAASGISIHPICELCNQPIEDGQIHVDHVIPFNGISDPKRLDPANLRVCHKACHIKVTVLASNGRD